MPDPTLQEVLDAYEAEWPMGPGHPGVKRREMFTRDEVAVLIKAIDECVEYVELWGDW